MSSQSALVAATTNGSGGILHANRMTLLASTVAICLSISVVYLWKANQQLARRIPGYKTQSNRFLCLEKLEREFTISPSALKTLVLRFQEAMEEGLDHDGASIAMLPSYLDRLPTGMEKGSYLALDLGGTNFRVLELVLEGQGRVKTKQRKFYISDELKVSGGEALFDFMAESVAAFLMELHETLEHQYELGFTFSFPILQTNINRGTLMHWNKGFACEDVVGQDVVDFLQRSFNKKNLKIKVRALVNDTVGTMCTSAYMNPSSRMGVILGTGTNAAYVEQMGRIKKWRGPSVDTDEMVINMEWGNFDAERKSLPFTAYDVTLDQSSRNVGLQLYEKMISGLYLGEIVRLIMSDLVDNNFLFGGRTSPTMQTMHAFDTSFMSRIEKDTSTNLSDTRIVLEDLMGIKRTTINDRLIVKRLCELVSTRAARLSAVGIAAVVSKMNKLNGCTIAVDGSVYEHYPNFSSRMRDALLELFGLAGDDVDMVLTKDGSGVGAALVASVVKNVRSPSC